MKNNDFWLINLLVILITASSKEKSDGKVDVLLNIALLANATVLLIETIKEVGVIIGKLKAKKQNID